MKKIIFLQINGKSYGGVAQVNKLVGEELIKHGYKVSIISIRNNLGDECLNYNSQIDVRTINEKDLWGGVSGSEIIEELKKLKIIKATKMVYDRFTHEIKLHKDIQKLQKILIEENPNCIVTSHYQILDMIPKNMLNKVVNVHHSSFKNVSGHKATQKTLLKYKDKVFFVWLTKNTMKIAETYGFKNNKYIYNAVRFKSKESANVTDNKKLIAVSRISKEKNIDLMVDIVDEVLEDKRFSDWKMEIFGSGSARDEETIKNSIRHKKQIRLAGLTNDTKNEMLKSSINLNTSSFEGFSLTILEANECGVPTISFNFGESTSEEILNNKTGFIVQGREEYIKKLKELMINKEMLLKFSKECKEFSKQFQIDNIIKEWIKVFDEIDNKNQKSK